MPTYVYEVLDDAGKPTGETLEIVQSMRDDALERDPKTGRPIRRAILPPNIGGNWSSASNKGKLSNKNLERLGFTKYERRGKGLMERTAGKAGPRSIGLDD